MKLFITILLLTFQLVSIAQSEKFTGTWSGTLSGGVDLRVVFNISQNENGSYTSTSDSPDQGVFGIKCDTTIIESGNIEIRMSGLNAFYKGKMVNDSTIAGSFSQGMELPLSLKKITAITPPKKNRPQTPEPPFSYKSQEIIFTGKKTGLDYGATITIPNGKGPFPAAILITGSGPQNRDEEVFEHKPFAVLADHLTKRGFIVLRMDDRGVGKTTGNFGQSTSADFANDIAEAIEFLKTRSEADKKKIGLIGHSEGGLIAPMLASSRKDIDFIVLLAAPGVPVMDLMLKQNSEILKSEGISNAAVGIYLPLYKNLVNAIIAQTDSAAEMTAAKNVVETWINKSDKTLVNELGLSSQKGVETFTRNMVSAISSPWYKYFMQFDPQPYLEKLKVKVLALNGDKDIQVVSGQNLPGIESALKKSGTKHYSIQEIKGQNHLFQSCKKCNTNEYGELEESFSPVTLLLISDWLEKNVK
jgi:uncharacterized protein